MGWEKIFHTNGNQKTAGVNVLMSDKMDPKAKTVIRDKGCHYITIRGQSDKRI